MVDNYGSADRVECKDYGASIRRSNLSRYVALHGVQVRQRSSSAGSLSCRAITIQRSQTFRSRSPSRDSNSSNAALGLPEPVCSNYRRAESVSELSALEGHRYGGLSFADYLVAGAAAVTVTEQHSIFDINRLCDFVARYYPQIPSAARLYLIVGAASGAQYAAHMHFFTESHFSCDDPNRKHLAQGTRCSFSSWNLGLVQTLHYICLNRRQRQFATKMCKSTIRQSSDSIVQDLRRSVKGNIIPASYLHVSHTAALFTLHQKG
jgi:hypothetical protein